MAAGTAIDLGIDLKLKNDVFFSVRFTWNYVAWRKAGPRPAPSTAWVMTCGFCHLLEVVNIHQQPKGITRNSAVRNQKNGLRQMSET